MDKILETMPHLILIEYPCARGTMGSMRAALVVRHDGMDVFQGPSSVASP